VRSGETADPRRELLRRHLATAAILGLLLVPAQVNAITPAASYSVKFTTFRTPVARGTQAKVTIHTGPEGKCSIKVVYQDGKVSLPGLGRKTANGSGNATWKWIVPANTTPGAYPVTVTCQSGDHVAKASRKMTVTG
jgi:hypothetical protein